MRILVADSIPEAAQGRLAEFGSLSYEPTLAGQSLAEGVRGHEVLVVRSTRVSAEIIVAADDLELIVRAGACTNTIDLRAAADRAIYVANCPGKNSVAVAELTIGLLIALDRRIPQASAELHRGQWNKKLYGQAQGLKGRTFGVVGVGGVGREVIERVRALGMEVVAYSRSLTSERAAALGVRRADSLKQLAGLCGAVSIHLAYCEETKHCIDADFIAALPDGAIVINVARPGIVDESAMLIALQQRGMRYGADVFDGEPEASQASIRSQIAEHPQTVATPHIGASTEQAQRAVLDEVVRIVSLFQKG